MNQEGRQTTRALTLALPLPLPLTDDPYRDELFAATAEAATTLNGVPALCSGAETMDEVVLVS